LTGAATYPFELSVRQQALLPLTDPSIAFILLILGRVGVYIEFTHPGLIFPGVAGCILVIISLMALSLLPINWAGAALIVLGIVFFVLEAMIISGGILGAGGAIAMILGTVLLIDTEVPELSIGWGTAIGATLPFALITIFLLRLAVTSFRYKVATGAEAMVGEVGVAKTEITAEGRVFVHGEWWNARAAQPIAEGAKVRIVGVDGLLLDVAPADGPESAPAE
jgi:membrane-bound serine protease (ClpP class)